LVHLFLPTPRFGAIDPKRIGIYVSKKVCKTLLRMFGTKDYWRYLTPCSGIQSRRLLKPALQPIVESFNAV
jgi:hypothetical protein